MRRAIAIAATLVAAGIAAGSASAVHPNARRGVASSYYLAHNPRALTRLDAGWAYDWSWRAPAAAPGLEWVPMLWGAGSVTGGSLAALAGDRRAGRARFLLGFNEPDSRSQANMTPAQAAALWPRLEATGLRLGSPAVAVPTDGWLDRFMSLAGTRRLRVDFIALHFYQDFTDPHAVDQLRDQLIAIHRRYGKPLWITEIGTLDIRAWGEHMHATPTASRASAYMRMLLPMLDRLPFVQRYAWFTDVCSADAGCPYSALFTRSGRLTGRGKIYRPQS